MFNLNTQLIENIQLAECRYAQILVGNEVYTLVEKN